MAWFRIDDNFYDHPKVEDLDLAAVGLWAVCGTYVARHLTDGFIPERRVARLGGTPELINELIEAELWDPADGGYLFRNWGEYQPTRNEVEDKREQARLRQQRKRKRDSNGRYAKEGSGVTPMSRVTHGGVTALVTPEVTTPGRSGIKPGKNDNIIGVELIDEEIFDANHAANAETAKIIETQSEPLDIDPTSSSVTPDVTRDSQRDSRTGHAVSHTSPDPTRPIPIDTLSSHAASGGEDGAAQPKEPEFSEDVTGLSNHLADWIIRNGNRKPRVTKTWHQAIDRLIRIDGFTPDQIRQVIDWSQQDEFWQGNILSAPKLRKQFDQLKNRMFQQGNRGQHRNPSLAPGSQRALNTLQLGQALQAAHDNPQELR